MKKNDTKEPMITDKKVQDMQAAFKRILAMPITKSTFREMQSVVLKIAEGDVNAANAVFESLIEGKPKANLDGKGSSFTSFINDFSTPVRTAKDVFEKGEFINFLSSDLLNQPAYALFLNRIRRVDGTEFQFITDPESTIHVIQHFIGRLKEMEKNESSRKALDNFKKELKLIQDEVTKIATR